MLFVFRFQTIQKAPIPKSNRFWLLKSLAGSRAAQKFRTWSQVRSEVRKEYIFLDFGPNFWISLRILGLNPCCFLCTLVQIPNSANPCKNKNTDTQTTTARAVHYLRGSQVISFLSLATKNVPLRDDLSTIQIEPDTWVYKLAAINKIPKSCWT